MLIIIITFLKQDPETSSLFLFFNPIKMINVLNNKGKGSLAAWTEQWENSTLARVSCGLTSSMWSGLDIFYYLLFFFEINIAFLVTVGWQYREIIELSYKKNPNI